MSNYPGKEGIINLLLLLLLLGIIISRVSDDIYISDTAFFDILMSTSLATVIS